MRELADRLTAALGAEHVIQDRRQLRLYRGGPWGAADPEGRYGRTPAIAVRPGDGAQVASCLAAIAESGRPIVALGGGTGLTGGQLPTDRTVVVDLGRLDAIHEIDAASRRARVGAAVRLGDLARAAEERGLLFAHDPWSRDLASVGGAISTNGVGYLAAGYGTMGQQVLGLTVALTSGELLALSTAATSAAGPDLSRLFVGSEGTLGVIVDATVRLFPLPERRIFLGYRFPRFEDGFAALQAAAALGLRPAMVDYEEDDDAQTATAMLAVDGIAAVAEAVAERLAALAAAHGAERLPDREVKRFWRTRHASAVSYARQREELRAALLAAEADPPVARPAGRSWRYLHLALPAGRVVPFLADARRRARERGVELRNAGIWATPELLSMVVAGAAPAADALAEELQLETARLGGSPEYCHGVGLRMAHLMPLALGPAFPVLARVKRALDPAGLLNPGKQGLH
jgi:FAD/FMN-containing dehydrogenase